MVSRRLLLLSTAAMATTQPVLGESSSKQWQAGVHYDRISPPQPLPGDRRKVEVIEFFWYGCPHCFTLEPHLVLWERYKPANVELVKIPVAWRAERTAHARLFFTLRNLQRLDVHGEIFDAIHRRRIPLSTTQEQAAFLQPRGIDMKKFVEIYQSTTVDAELQRTDQLSRSYKISGVPTVSVQGRYLTTIGQAQGEAGVIALIKHLVSLTSPSG